MSTLHARVCLWCGHTAYTGDALEKHFIEKHTGKNRPVAEPLAPIKKKLKKKK